MEEDQLSVVSGGGTAPNILRLKRCVKEGWVPWEFSHRALFKFTSVIKKINKDKFPEVNTI